MNQNVIVVASIVGFIVIASLSVFIYFQDSTQLSHRGIYCLFENDSLLNYLHDPQCNRPAGIELDENHGCVTYTNNNAYVKVQCEDPNKAWIKNGCLYINLGENNTLTKCP